MTPRRGLLAKIHIAKKETGLDDGEYRLLLKRVTGKASAADCTDGQLEAVVAEFKAKGWKPKPRRKSPASSHKKGPDQADKIRALWIEMGKTGIVRDGSDAALNRYVQKRTGVDNIKWLNGQQRYSVLEGLKAWGGREYLRRAWADAAMHGYDQTEAALLGFVQRAVRDYNVFQPGTQRVAIPHTISRITWAAAGLARETLEADIRRKQAEAKRRQADEGQRAL